MPVGAGAWPSLGVPSPQQSAQRTSTFKGTSGEGPGIKRQRKTPNVFCTFLKYIIA